MKSPALLVVLFASACSPSSEGETKRNLESQAEDVSDCCKLEGAEIGREDVLVRLGSKYVLVNDWVGKTGEAGEYVGFTITVAGGDAATYVVKASGELYPSSALTWMHPNGPDGGSQSPGISNVDFCGECDDPDGCEDGGGDNPPPCDNPDGCDGGGGGGDNPPPCDNPDGCDGGGGGIFL